MLWIYQGALAKLQSIIINQLTHIFSPGDKEISVRVVNAKVKMYSRKNLEAQIYFARSVKD